MPCSRKRRLSRLNLNVRTFNRKKSRAFVVYEGLPFYRSSGRNSGSAGTWFPCLGVQSDNNVFNISTCRQTQHKMGWIIKGRTLARRLHFDSNTKSRVLKRDPIYGNFPIGKNRAGKEIGSKNFLNRMQHTKLMLISSKLEGGVWQTRFGRQLRRSLKKEHPELDKIVLDKTFSNIKGLASSRENVANDINQFLKSEGACATSATAFLTL